MPDGNGQFDKAILGHYFEQWAAERENIERAYAEKNSDAIEMMQTAISLYEDLLASVSKRLDDRSGNTISVLLPLNGLERLQFVKDKIASHYSFVQLDALFLETKKKAARLSIAAKKTEA